MEREEEDDNQGPGEYHLVSSASKSSRVYETMEHLFWGFSYFGTLAHMLQRGLFQTESGGDLLLSEIREQKAGPSNGKASETRHSNKVTEWELTFEGLFFALELLRFK